MGEEGRKEVGKAELESQCLPSLCEALSLIPALELKKTGEDSAFRREGETRRLEEPKGHRGKKFTHTKKFMRRQEGKHRV